MSLQVNTSFLGPVRNVLAYVLSDDQLRHDMTAKMFDNIPHKKSKVVDDIQTLLRKYGKFDLLKAVTKTVNQSLTTGIFPDNLKLAKVIPLFRKCDPTSINIYRPISHLPALSKIFDCVIYNQVNNYFTLNTLYYERQNGFHSKIQLNWLPLTSSTLLQVEWKKAIY